MKKAISILSTILILFLISFGCSSSDDSSVSNDSGSDKTETSFNFTMSSFLKQETSSSSERQAAFTADQIMTGTLTATNTDDSSTQNFDWSIYLDEGTFAVQSNKTIILAPGTYDFVLLLTKGDQQYSGATAGVSISDGTFDVPMTIRPVIGNTVTDVSLVESLADFKFQYDPAELDVLNTPQLGVIVDGGTEEIFAINPTTGISDNYINLDAGAHTLQLKLYDGSLQKGRSIAAQESIVVSAGLDITMDLVALHGETTFALTEDGGDATFSFNIPAEVVDEAGGLGNLEVLFSMSGDNNPLEQNLLTLADDGSGGYESSITLTDKQFDEIGLTLTFTDTLNSELLGSCSATTTLDTTERTLNCDLTLRRRAIVGGFLSATFGVNVFNEAGEPVKGTHIYNMQNGVLLGITGDGSFGTNGYIKFYLPAGSHQFKAINASKYHITNVTSSVLGIENIDITLDLPFNEGIEVVGGAMSISREVQFPTYGPVAYWRGLQTPQTPTSQISANVTVDQFSGSGTIPKARLQMIYRPNGYFSMLHATGIEIQLRAEGGNLIQIASIFHCLNENCDNYESAVPVSGDFQFGMPLTVGLPHSLSIEYLGDGYSFQISVDGQTGILDATQLANFSYFNPGDFSHGRISLRFDDPEPYGDYTSMTALYDDVYVNNALYDDFSDLSVTLTKWNNWK